MLRSRRSPIVLRLLVILVAMAMSGAAHARTGESRPAPTAPPQYRFSLSYTPIYQFETDLDVGGEVDVQRHFFRFDISRMVHRQWIIGLGLSFDYERWNFSDIAGLAGVDLWDEIIRPGINLPIIYNTANQWRLMVVPGVEFSGATGAEIDESLSYGVVLSIMHAVTPNLMIGIGAGVFDRLDEGEYFPFLAIDWKINDRVKLSNPFQAGPAGPAGLELVYSPTDKLEMGVGGAFRSYRFRLDDSSSVADGTGKVESWVTFLRAGWRFGERYQLDLNTGALLDGKISIDDANGNDLGETGTDTAPFVALSVKGQF